MTGRYSVDRSNSAAASTGSSKSGGGGHDGKTNGHHHNHGHNRRSRSDSSGHSSGHSHHHHSHPGHPHHPHPRKPQSKKDLWKGSVDRDVGDSVIVQMVGMESANHACYARVDPSCSASPEALSKVPIGKVIEVMVDEGWKSVAKTILEKGVHVETADSYPTAAELLKLGAVWILNETLYAAGENAHARRLGPKDEHGTPDWKGMTLRVHYVPDRFFVAHEVDWTKYCRGLLLDNCTSAVVGGRKQLVPMDKLPDGKDGVIVYENDDIGFAILNKPGGMPCHSTISNHAEDVASMFGAALKERHSHDEDHHKHFLSIPLRVEPETHGLTLAATKKEFCSYMTKQLEEGAGTRRRSSDGGDKSANSSVASDGSRDHASPVTKTYRCLVCVRDPADIDRIEKLVGRTIEHHVDVRSPAPKKFVRNRPKNSKAEWQKCKMRILNIGQSKNFRAACVSSRYADSNDSTLAHRLWCPESEHPAEDIGVTYVMQLDVQLLTRAPHQIRGQLAALGVPIVGDGPYGGGVCEMRMHRHVWDRMAVQVCHMEFDMPRWEEVEEGEDGKKKRVLVPPSPEEGKEGGGRCVFHLNTCWWSEYLVDYERYLLSGAVGQ